MQLIERANLQVIYETECQHLAKVNPALRPPTLDQFEAFFAGAPGVSFMDGERCVGSLVVRNGMAHIGVLPEHQGTWGRLWPAAYRWAFGVSDPVFAMVQPGNKRATKLVLRTGGKHVDTITVPHMGTMFIYELRDCTTPYPRSVALRKNCGLASSVAIDDCKSGGAG